MAAGNTTTIMETTPMIQRPMTTAQIKRYFSRYEFENAELERLYQRYVFKLQQASLGHLVSLSCLLCACLAVLNFYYVEGGISIPGIYVCVEFTIFLLLYIFINTRFMKESHLRIVCLIILIFLVGFVVFSMPIAVNFGLPSGRPRPIYTPAHGAWEVMYAVFVIYSMMPLQTYLSAILGILLPVGHLVVTAIVADNVPGLLWRHVSGYFSLFEFNL